MEAMKSYGLKTNSGDGQQQLYLQMMSSTREKGQWCREHSGAAQWCSETQWWSETQWHSETQWCSEHNGAVNAVA